MLELADTKANDETINHVHENITAGKGLAGTVSSVEEPPRCIVDTSRISKVPERLKLKELLEKRTRAVSAMDAAGKSGAYAARMKGWDDQISELEAKIFELRKQRRADLEQFDDEIEAAQKPHSDEIDRIEAEIEPLGVEARTDETDCCHLTGVLLLDGDDVLENWDGNKRVLAEALFAPSVSETESTDDCDCDGNHHSGDF